MRKVVGSTVGPDLFFLFKNMGFPKIGCEKASLFLGIKITSPIKTIFGSFHNQKSGFFLSVAVTFGNSYLIIINLLQTIQGKSRSIKRLK